MRRLMIGLVGVCLALGKGGLVSADMIVIGSPELLHGYSPNPTSVEYPTYLSPDGDFMLVRSTTNDIGSRTWDTGTGQWGAVTPLSGISGSGYNYATLSPDGNSMFLGSSGVIQRSKLQLSGTWSTPQTIVPGGVNVYAYFNGQQLFFSHLDSGVYHIMESDYNSSLDTFSTPQRITAIEGPAGTGEVAPWVSQNGEDMIFVRLGIGDATQDLYSAHWNGSQWGTGTPLPYVHEDVLNGGPCVAENAGKLVFSSAPSPFANTYTIWEATVVPEPSTFALLGVGGISLLAYAWRRKRRAV